MVMIREVDNVEDIDSSVSVAVSAATFQWHILTIGDMDRLGTFHRI